ncbi:hypothetical protein J4450_01015 [Candidatus Micrarchaeota archaeon]|nr:hypothetical protein [Candidatus Micrarchaeota archaeon]
MQKKLAIGWFTFTCCEDSSILFVELLNEHYFEWKKLIEFRHCKMLKSINQFGPFDVAFVEGAISSDKERKKLEKIKHISKYLVAIGECACTGFPSAQRNNFSAELQKEIKPLIKKFHLLEKVHPLESFVKVDERVPGCPMDPNVFLKTLDNCLKKFKVI